MKPFDNCPEWTAPVTLGQEPKVHPSSRVVACQLGGYIEIAARSLVVESTLGDYSYAMGDVEIWYAEVGKFCNIAAFAAIGPNNHPFTRATQHHFTYRSARYGFGPDDPGVFNWRRAARVTIGPDVWIGHGAKILPGNTLGAGVIVGSGAVVTRDLPDYAVAVGAPARVVKFRFPEQIRQGLLNLAWWDWTHQQLKEALPDFRNLNGEEFLDKYG